MTKKLGKGLEALFGEDIKKVIDQINENEIPNDIENQIVNIKVTDIMVNPYQPRKVFDESRLKDLSKTIKEFGVFTPIVVKENEAGKYYIIAGERRFRATKLAGLKKIPAIIRDVTDKEMAEIAIIENIQRENLNPVEEAVAINELIESHNITQEQAAKRLGKSRTYVTNLLRILKTDSKVMDAVLESKISHGHAKAIAALPNKEQRMMLKKILESNLNVRDVESLVKKTKPTTKKNTKSEDYTYVEDLVRNKLKTKVEITNNKITIKYKGNDQLNRILERIGALEDGN